MQKSELSNLSETLLMDDDTDRQCERIREAVEKFKFCHAEACEQATISIGFHLYRPDNGKVESLIDDLIDKAEQALYLAKEKGKNQTQAFF